LHCGTIKILDNLNKKLYKSDSLFSLKEDIDNLIKYCEEEKWLGYDPFDGLNSPIFKYLFLNRNKYLRIFIIQFFKNFPFNLRPLFFIKKETNAKGLSLFLSSMLIFYKYTNDEKYLLNINKLTNLLLKERKVNNLDLWGYNFDWQSRAFFVRKNCPNFVVSYFVLSSFFELYNLTKEEKHKEIFISSCKKLISNFLEESRGKNYFKYVLNDKKLIHNVNLFGASLMSKAFYLTGDIEFLDISEKTLETSVRCQQENGAWPYGEEKIHEWVDSFHTCYNLLSLNDFIINTKNKTFENNLIKGFNYFINNFFAENFIVKYYNNKIYPIDIHSFTTALITLIELERYLKDKSLIINTYNFINNNFKSLKGFYYFRSYKILKNKIPYMRWNQSWTMYALAKLYEYILKVEVRTVE
jgi:hypothetical protein